MLLPLQLAIGLLVLMILGALGAIWIMFAILRQVGVRRLSSYLALSPPAEASDDDDYFGLPGSGTVARGLLQLISARTGCSFAALFLPKHGEDYLIVSTVEGTPGPWTSAELAYLHPVVRGIVASGRPAELVDDEAEVSLPRRTVLFPVLSRGHLIAAVAAGPREDGRAVSTRDRRLVTSVVSRAAAPLENAQLYRSLRRAFTDVENAQRELLALQRVSVAAQSTLRLDQVLAQIAEGVVDGLSFDLAGAYLVDAASQTITMPVMSHSPAPPESNGAAISLDSNSPTMRALLSNEVLITHDLGESLLPHLFGAGVLHETDVPSSSTIANLPLVSKGHTIGGMVLTTRRPALSGSEIESLRSFAAQAAATIENARLYGELERAYSDVRTAQEQLIRAERLRTLGQVASGVAHDFNNILAAILTRVQLAQQQTRSPGLRDTLRVIEQAALDGANATRRIQSLARPRDGSEPDRLDLSSIAYQAMDLTRPLWSNAARVRGVAIAEQTALIPGAFVTGQAGELREVLTNLILNATAAMPAGGTLGVRTELRNGQVWCTVEDTGTGMTEDVKQRVFDPFFTTKGDAGSGLGMSIVAAILERHRGKIEITTEPGRGTAVRFGLDASSDSDRPALPDKPHGHASLRILLAGEDDAELDALALILGRHAHRVCSASTAEEAIQLLVDQEFDVIIADLALGTRSGWDVAEAAQRARPSAAVVLATAWADDWDDNQAHERGVEGILRKPYTVDELLGCIEQALIRG